ncbi:MAG: hypothetical protein R3195_17320 [Gemmatimonadota bacterium]|nr:hypothetical protein [Gemmatimonadota bacterium]
MRYGRERLTKRRAAVDTVDGKGAAEGAGGAGGADLGGTTGGAVILAMAIALTLPGDLTAQRHGGHVHGEPEYEEQLVPVPVAYSTPRFRVGGGLGMFVPQGEFGRFVGEGFAATGHMIVGVEPSNTFALRFEGGYVNYGSVSWGSSACCYGPPGPGIRTTNNIATFGVGPQLQASMGAVQPYINGYVGSGYFYTHSSANDGWYHYAHSLNFDDWAFGYGGGGGLAIAFGGGSPVLLNFDVQYRRHDDVQYLTEGGIYDDGFGGTIVEPVYSNADFWTFQMGLSFGF